MELFIVPGWQRRQGVFGHLIGQAIPNPVKSPQTWRRGQHIQKSLQLGCMRAIDLRVNLPNKWFARPDSANHLVFAPHKIDVAGPEKVVKVCLTE